MSVFGNESCTLNSIIILTMGLVLIKVRYSVVSAPALLGNTRVVKVPGRVHHDFEVLIVVNAHGDIVVVLNPLVQRDLAVAWLAKHGAGVDLEGVEELHEDVVLSLLSGPNIRVELGIVGLPDVINVKHSTAVFVHDLESLLGEANTEIVHLTTNTSQELVVVNAPRSVPVEDAEEAL